MHQLYDQDKKSYKNEQIKRAFFVHLRGAKGFTEASVRDYAEAVGQWQLFSNNEEFATFSSPKATQFKDWLIQRRSKAKAGKLSLTTQYHYLRRVKEFFEWLADRPGYRGKVLKDEVAFLRLSKKDMHAVLSGTSKIIPTLEETRKVIEYIEPKSEVDMRDRALISFALISGCRIFAIVSLRMKSFDKEKRIIYQNPGDDVKTKNSKKILSTFFPIGWEEPERYFIEWYEHLEQKGFGPNDPIFPATRTEIDSTQPVHGNDTVSSGFWAGTGSARSIFQKRCANAGVPYYHPHSFRHLVVSIMSKMRLTEEDKRAISLTLGHTNVGTTFGSYGYGSMNDQRAVEIVQQLQVLHNNDSSSGLTDEERVVLMKLNSLWSPPQGQRGIE